MAYRVFISYRRDDPMAAQWLEERLSREEMLIGEVFFDTRAIDPGDPFPRRIQEALESSLVFVFMMGKGWDIGSSAHGIPRLSERDPVRKEVVEALKQQRLDPRKLVLPVLYNGMKMPAEEALPEDMRALHEANARELASDHFADGFDAVVDHIIRRIDEFEQIPEEERWVVRELAAPLELMPKQGLRQIARKLKSDFPEAGDPPDSPRSLAAAIYRLGPAALGCLLSGGGLSKNFDWLLRLLATHWIDVATAGEMRSIMLHAPTGKRLGLRCDYADFTPEESLLKASRLSGGWPNVTVKGSDNPQEIVQQVHEALFEHFKELLRATNPANVSKTQLCDELRWALESKGKTLPVVLRLEHRAGLDPSLLGALWRAFPELHILIATVNDKELKRATTVSKIYYPSQRPEAENTAWKDFARAQQKLRSYNGGRP